MPAQTFKFNNYSMLAPNKDDYFDWCVFMDEPDDVIKTINHVEYLLHPTFNNPLRKVSTPENKFALYSGGWGVFTIKIKVFLESGEIIDTSYGLKLADDDWPKKDTIDDLDMDELNILNSITDSKYKWRKPDTIMKALNLDKTKFEVHLNNMILKSAVRKYPFESIDGSELIGATKEIGIEPKAKLF